MTRSRQHSTRTSKTQSWESNNRNTPISHSRTKRVDAISNISTSKAGKFVPLAMIPLLREDGAMNSTLNVNLQMAETANMLLNAVKVNACAYLVPKLAFERFNDMGTIDRSYNGQPEVDGAVVSWFKTMDVSNPSNEFARALGMHFATGVEYNDDYLRAYNVLWNYLASERSIELSPRTEQDNTLAPAFWPNTQMKHVVPRFDDAMIEGVVPLTVVDGKVDITMGDQGQSWRAVKTDGSAPPTGDIGATLGPDGAVVMSGTNNIKFDPRGTLVAELTEQGVSVSLANIDLARQTAAWARLRSQFQGKSEDWMMDQLLAGIRLNDAGMKQPVLLDKAETVVGMSQRYATDAVNLKKSVVDGRTSLQLRIRTPRVECGGVIVVCAQALPEQIYERQRDYYMAATSVSDLPNRTADELDPQPVAMVKKAEVDEQHTKGDELFGYAPLNHEWMRKSPKVGGRFHRINPNAAWTEDRNRIWDTGVVDPELGPDFYLASSLQHEVFEDSNTDQLEWWTNGSVVIDGFTYFGPALRDTIGQFEKVYDQVDQTRLTGDGTDT